MTTIRPQCFECARAIYRADGAFTFRCEAFGPDVEIPREIIANEFDHEKPYPGDNGLRFLQKD